MRTPIPDPTPNQPIREAVQASGCTLYEIADKLGWYCSRSSGSRELRPDTSRLQRTLGLKASINGKGMTNTNKNMNYSTALNIIRAIGLDPRDVGL